MKKLPSKLALFLSLAGLAVTTQVDAAPIVNYNGGAQAGETTYDSNILATDLINTGQTSLLSTTDSGKAIDGLASSGDTSHDDFFSNPSGNTLVFNLNLNPLTGGSATGYTVTQINSIAGWAGAGFAAQDFTLTLYTLSTPGGYAYGGTFLNNANVNLTDSQSSMTTITDSTGSLATGVTSLVFNYTTPVPGGNFGTVLRELDVISSPMDVVPEPSTYALLLGGFTLLLVCLRRQSKINLNAK